VRATGAFLSLAVTGLCGCQGGAVSTEVPARLTAPTPESHAELTSVVSRALGREDLILADDALTRDGRLIIERQPNRTLAQGRIPGRDLQPPEQFRLLKQGERCILVHAGTDERWTLNRSHCVPVAGS
jgi:hypothetical protein